MHGRRVCMAGGHAWQGCAWHGDVAGVCMVGGSCMVCMVGGACMAGGIATAVDVRILLEYILVVFHSIFRILFPPTPGPNTPSDPFFCNEYIPFSWKRNGLFHLK